MKTLHYFLFILGFFPALAQARTSIQNFAIEAGFLGPADGKISYTIDSNTYDISASVAAKGLIEKIYGYEGKFHSNGLFRHEKPTALIYEYTSIAGGDERKKTVTMDEHGKPRQRYTLRKGRSKNVDIDLPAFDFDAPDMLTAFGSLIRQFQNKSFCDLRQTVFDGKKRYEISFSDQGKITPRDLKIRPSGDVWQCAMQIRAIDEDDEDFLWKVTSQNPILFWIVKDQKTTLPYIAKIQIDSTPVGSIKAYNINNQILEE